MIAEKNTLLIQPGVQQALELMILKLTTNTTCTSEGEMAIFGNICSFFYSYNKNLDNPETAVVILPPTPLALFTAELLLIND